MVIVVVPPRFERLLQVLQVQEPVQRETLASQRAVEGLDERIVHRLAGPAELERDVLPVRPMIQQPRGELGAVVHGDALRKPARGTRLGQRARHVPTREGRGAHERHALAPVDVEHRQDPYCAPVRQGVVHEIHRPLLIRLRGRRQAGPGHRTAMPPRPAPSERQPLLGVQPIDPLVVHPPPLPPQEHMQLLVAGP